MRAEYSLQAPWFQHEVTLRPALEKVRVTLIRTDIQQHLPPHTTVQGSAEQLSYAEEGQTSAAGSSGVGHQEPAWLTQ